MANLSSARREISAKTSQADNDPVDREPLDAEISRQRNPRVNQVLRLIGNEGFLRISRGYSPQDTEKVLVILGSKLEQLQKFQADGRSRQVDHGPCDATMYALHYGIPGIVASLGNVEEVSGAFNKIIDLTEALRNRAGKDAHIAFRWSLDAYLKAFQLEKRSAFPAMHLEPLHHIAELSLPRLVSPAILALASVVQARKEQALSNGKEFIVHAGVLNRLVFFVITGKLDEAADLSDGKLDVIVKHGLPALLKDRTTSVDLEQCFDDLIALARTPGFESTNLHFAIRRNPGILRGSRSKSPAERAKLLSDY